MDTTKVVLNRPRISIECTDRHARIIKEHLEYGMQKRLFNLLLDDLCDLIEEYGPGIIHALILGKASFKEHLKDGYIRGLSVAQHIAASAGASTPVGDSGSGAPEADTSKAGNN